MANVREYIQINPRVKTNKALGIVFPFNVEGVFPLSYTTKEQVKSNLINLLLTSPGERLMNPEFGIGIRQYLFEQVIDKEFLKNKITDGAQTYIPEIEIDDVFIKRENLTTTPELHTVRISLYYKVLADRSTDAILLNFN